MTHLESYYNNFIYKPISLIKLNKLKSLGLEIAYPWSLG